MRAQQLIGKLAQALPSYRLPIASMAHSRHFMPIGSLAKGREQTTLVFDTWANVGDGELMIYWPCDLDNEETVLLRQLAATLGYLGRSESWVEAELIVDDVNSATAFDAIPHVVGFHPGHQWEQISLMAAIPLDEYDSWRKSITEPILQTNDNPTSSRKPTAKQLEKQNSARAQALAPYPPDLLSCLTKDTAWWKQNGWSQPPGSQRVLYWRRSDSLQVGLPSLSKSLIARPVTTMLLALTTASGNLSALPPCSRTLPQAELFHRAVVGLVGKGLRVHCPELTGKDQHNRPLKNGHQHAHILPVDLDCDGRIDHLIIYAGMGLGDGAQRAIRTLRRTWTKGGDGEIQLALAGAGEIGILRRLPPPLKQSIEQLLGPPERARVWESVTPFVAPRFIKPIGRNTLLGQIRAELASRRLPTVERIDLAASENLTRKLRHYVRRRYHGGTPPPLDMGYGLRLIFSEPIQGPLMLGYASHFGMGLFRALND